MSTRYQWSKKVGEEIVLIEQTESDIDSFVEKVRVEKDKLASLIIYRTITEPVVTQTTNFTPSPATQATSQQSTGTLICQTCGGKAEVKEGTSKAGNHYKIFRCISNPETQPNGHSKFIK